MLLKTLAEEERLEADEDIVGVTEFVDWVLLTSEDAIVEEVAAIELLRALDEFPPAALPDLVLLTEAN